MLEGKIGELIQDNNSRPIPKDFVRGIRIPFGPLEGVLAKPCHCNYPTDPDDLDVFLIIWYRTQTPMYVHRSCLENDAEI